MKKIFVVGFGLIASVKAAFAAMYAGNLDTTGGGAVGTGSLTLTDNGTTLFGTFTRGTGGARTFTDVLVIFIDSKSGGFANTGGFTDDSVGLRSAVSGFHSFSRSTAFFTSGFLADYAIALRPAASSGNDQLFELGTGAFTALGSVNLSPKGSGTDTSSTYTFSLSLSAIGVAPGGSFKIETDLVTTDGQQHYLESFETFDLGASDISNMVTFNSSHTYVTAVPEMTNGALAAFGGIFLAVRALTHARLLKRNAKTGIPEQEFETTRRGLTKIG